jgi:hypothetical protein
MTPCGSRKKQTFRPHHQGGINRQTTTANVVLSLHNFPTLMMVEICSSETSILTTAARRQTPVDSIFHCHRRENLNLTASSVANCSHNLSRQADRLTSRMTENWDLVWRVWSGDNITVPRSEVIWRLENEYVHFLIPPPDGVWWWALWSGCLVKFPLLSWHIRKAGFRTGQM